MNSIKYLQELAKGKSILYVEDNDALRKNVTKLLKKFFSFVDTAANGKIALDKIKQHHYPIIITDIKMPLIDGLTLTKHVKHTYPETKTIIMSAYDDKETLLQSIELGIFRFIKKPVNVNEFSDVLIKALLEIKQEQNTKLFYMHLKSVFNYQSSMVTMIHGDKIILANELFLDFFDCEAIDQCKEKFFSLSEVFLEHNGFLYNHDNQDAIETLKLNQDKIYHVKIQNKEKKMQHFLLKYHEIPEKSDHGVLSFDDVTELNLLKLFDTKQSNNDENIANTQAIFDLLEIIQRNSAKIDLHNYYKGLSITNNAIITEVKRDESITLKTTYIQQKAVQQEKKSLIVSNALPYPIACTEIDTISFEKQTIKMKTLKFVQTSPITRSTIRVVPGEKQTVSLFLGENKFYGEIQIEDISINAVKLRLNALPPGLEKDTEVRLDIVLELDKKPLIINTLATMFRKSENKHSFSVVFLFKELKKSNLIKYITKRQMELIREIKGMQNG